MSDLRLVRLEQQVAALVAELASLKLKKNPAGNAAPLPTRAGASRRGSCNREGGELYVLYDTETNGLGKTDAIRICQIGAIALDAHGDEMGTFNRFVNPLAAIDPQATAVNGIDPDFVNKLAAWDAVGADFNAWLSGLRDDNATSLCLCAHNGKRFDARILAFEHARHNLTLPVNLYHADTMPVFKDLMPRLNNYKLGTIYETAFHEPIPDAHTALADCRAMQRLLGTADPQRARSTLFKFRESFDAVLKRCFKGR